MKLPNQDVPRHFISVPQTLRLCTIASGIKIYTQDNSVSSVYLCFLL